MKLHKRFFLSSSVNRKTYLPEYLPLEKRTKLNELYKYNTNKTIYQKLYQTTSAFSIETKKNEIKKYIIKCILQEIMSVEKITYDDFNKWWLSQEIANQIYNFYEKITDGELRIIVKKAKLFILNGELLQKFKEYDMVFLRALSNTKQNLLTISELVSTQPPIKSYLEALANLNFGVNKKLQKNLMELTYNLLTQINIYCLESIDAWNLPIYITSESVQKAIDLLNMLNSLQFRKRHEYKIAFADAWILLSVIYLKEFGSLWHKRISDEKIEIVNKYLTYELGKHENLILELRERLFVQISANIPFSHLILVLNSVTIKFEDIVKIKFKLKTIEKYQRKEQANIEFATLPDMLYPINIKEFNKPVPSIFIGKIYLPPIA